MNLLWHLKTERKVIIELRQATNSNVQSCGGKSYTAVKATVKSLQHTIVI